MKKILIYLAIFGIVALMVNSFCYAANIVVIGDSNQSGIQLDKFTVDKLKFETGAVTPQFGSPGKYQFSTYLINPQGTNPEFVKIYFVAMEEAESVENFVSDDMKLINKSPDGKVSQYVYEKNFSEKEIGLYNFYFEAKVGNRIIHGPSYHGDDCKPGGCAECCGAWGGPKIYSQKLAENHKIYLFDKDKEKAILDFDVGKNWITSLAISADEKYLAAADDQAGLYVFKIGLSDLWWKFEGSFSSSSGELGMDRGQVAFSQNNLLAAALKGVVYLFKIDSDIPIWQYSIDKALNGLVISEDGKYLAAGGRDNKVSLWETNKPESVWQYEIISAGGIGGGSVVRTMDMTPDGRYFAAGTSCPDRSVYVFSPDKNQPIFAAKAGANFPVETVSISTDGKYVLVGGGGSREDPYSAALYQIGRQEPLWRFDYDKNPVISVALSPDGKNFALGYIISGIFGGQVNTKEPVWQLKNSGYIADLKFSQNNQYLAAASGINRVYLLSADGQNLLRNWPVENKAETVAISSSGKYLAAGTSLDRFIIFGVGGDNFSGAGVGELKEKNIELISLSSLSGKEGQLSKEFSDKSYVLLIIGGAIIIFILIVLWRWYAKKKRYNGHLS